MYRRLNRLRPVVERQRRCSERFPLQWECHLCYLRSHCQWLRSQRAPPNQTLMSGLAGWLQHWSQH